MAKGRGKEAVKPHALPGTQWSILKVQQITVILPFPLAVSEDSIFPAPQIKVGERVLPDPAKLDGEAAFQKRESFPRPGRGWKTSFLCSPSL